MIVFVRLLRDERGATMVEYSLLFAFFALICALSFQNVATNAGARYTTSTNQMTNVQEVPLATNSPGT